VSERLAWLDERRETHLLGLARVAFALMYAQHASKLLRLTLANGYFGDHFHISIVPEAWVPTRSVYLALLTLQILAALVAALGPLARPLLLLASSIGLYLFCCDRLDYHHNRYVLHLLVFLLSFTPCDRSFRAFSPKLPAPQRVQPVWAQRLIQVQISLVYLASAGSKLLDADWRGGQVLLLRYQTIGPWWIAHGHPVPEPLLRVLNSSTFADLSSKAAICTELFIALGLWFGRARAFALWLGVLFHLGIELGANVELFSYVMWASYLVFCVPELRERKLFYDSRLGFGRTVGRALRYLDWLARFEVSPARDEARARWGLSAIDRDGQKAEGLGALVLIARAVPALFPLWLPLLAFQRFTHARRSVP
jgi:hypothetical protein